MSNQQPTTLLELVDAWEQLARTSQAPDPGAMGYAQALRMCAKDLGRLLPKGAMGPVPHNGTDTSKAAAASIDAPNRKSWHDQIMDEFRTATSLAGLTCGEVEARLPHGTHQGISARIRELVKAGKLVDSGHRRKNPDSGRKARIYVGTGR